MKTTKTRRSDAADSAAKSEFVHEQAAGSAEFALKIATAIRNDPSLLDGLAPVVAILARHEQAAVILDAVFAKHARRYPKSYRAFVDVRFAMMFGKS